MDLFDVLRKYDLEPQKTKGQHFILDKGFLEREADYASVSKEDIVLEIGSGPANLTQVLASRAKKVIAIEKSKIFVKILRDIGLDNVEIIHSDAAKTDFEELKFDKCVSNIPYQISAAVTEKLLVLGKLSVICYQKEFAHKMMKKEVTRERSRLSLLVQYYCEPEILEEVPRGLFYPPPKIDSTLMRLNTKPVPFDTDGMFWNIIKAAYMHKNQTLRNSLIHSSSFLGISKETFKKLEGGLVSKKVYEIELADFREVQNMLKSIGLSG